LFQELANYPDTKFDWNELVNKTSTGISNAREYQMLWRHLAYGYSSPQDFKQEGDEPMVCLMLHPVSFISKNSFL